MQQKLAQISALQRALLVEELEKELVRLELLWSQLALVLVVSLVSGERLVLAVLEEQSH